MKIPIRIYLMGGCVLLISSIVSAYVLLSPQRTWGNPPTYIVDDRGMGSISDGDGGLSATINAITSNDAWNGAGFGTVVYAVSGNVGNFTLGDGTPMLSFEDPTGQCTGNCLAGTFTGFYERVGRGRSRNYQIYDADIVTNNTYGWTSQAEGGCSGEFYIEGVQVHEIGHGLGIGHSSVLGATMYPSVAACDNGPGTTEGDDEAALVALYGGSDGGVGSSCTLGQPGESCTANGQCCSGKCKGNPAAKTCR